MSKTAVVLSGLARVSGITTKESSHQKPTMGKGMEREWLVSLCMETE